MHLEQDSDRVHQNMFVAAPSGSVVGTQIVRSGSTGMQTWAAPPITCTTRFVLVHDVVDL